MCRPAGGTAQPAQKCFAEKEEEIEQGDNGEQRADEIQLRQGCNDIKGEQGRIQPCQPFDFDRENEQQHRGVGVEHGKSKKHGHIDVICAA